MHEKPLALVCALLLGNVVHAATAVPAPVATVEGITEYHLANGMKVLLAPDNSKPTTTVNVTYLVGSRHESYGETGMAHLLEHMVFKGTKTRSNIMQELGKRGMQFNGSTWFDRTNYYETFAANDANLKWALEMEADRMVNSTIQRKDLDSEFSVVRNEMESGENDPFQTLLKQLSAVTYDWHNYGHETIGARSDVEGVQISNLQQFYRRYYQPDNAVLVVAGKFEADKTLTLIQQTFGKLKKPTRQLNPSWTREPTRDGAREITVKRVGDVQLAMTLYPIAAGNHPDAAAMTLLSDIFGNTPSGRLHKAMVESKQAIGVQSFSFNLAEPGFVMFMAQLDKSASLANAKQTLLRVIENVAEQPISDDEVKLAKAHLRNRTEQSINDPEWLGVELSESIALGDWRYFFINRDRIEALTAADVQKVAEHYLKEDNRSYGQFVPNATPSRSEIPASEQVQAVAQRYQGRAAVAQGEAFDASPLNIDKRTVTSQLNNGAKLALLSKKNRGETVQARIALHLGDEKSLFNKGYIHDVTASMLLKGSQGLSRADVEAKLAELKASVNIRVYGQNVLVDVETTRPNIAATIDLLHSVLRQPTFSATEFERLIAENVALLEAQQNQPDAIANLALQQIANAAYKEGDIRYFDDIAQSLKAYRAVQLSDVKQFYQKFYGSNNAEISIVGDFDGDAVSKQLNQLFGDWSSAQSYARAPSLATPAQSLMRSFETPDKANAAYAAQLRFSMKDSAADYPAMLLINEVLGGSTKSRLLDRLRQHDGISYGAGSYVDIGGLDDNASLNLYAIYAPQNIDKLKTGVGEELQRLLNDGISAQELSDAKQALLQAQAVNQAQDRYLSFILNRNLLLNRHMAFYQELQTKVQALTLAEVNAAIKRYIKPELFAHIYAGDFANASKTPTKKSE